MSEEENNAPSEECAPELETKRPPKEVIDRMNRIIIAAAEAGKTPGELADDVYRKMFGVD